LGEIDGQSGGTDDRFLSYVGMGRRAAKFHEKLPPEVGQTIGFCRLSSSAAMAARRSFDPVGMGLRGPRNFMKNSMGWEPKPLRDRSLTVGTPG
jgi:hypothetical protein